MIIVRWQKGVYLVKRKGWLPQIVIAPSMGAVLRGLEEKGKR